MRGVKKGLNFSRSTPAVMPHVRTSSRQRGNTVTSGGRESGQSGQPFLTAGMVIVIPNTNTARSLQVRTHRLIGPILAKMEWRNTVKEYDDEAETPAQKARQASEEAAARKRAKV